MAIAEKSYFVCTKLEPSCQGCLAIVETIPVEQAMMHAGPARIRMPPMKVEARGLLVVKIILGVCFRENFVRCVAVDPTRALEPTMLTSTGNVGGAKFSSDVYTNRDAIADDNPAA